jgi:membrane protease YdiL (CAAX protease family)
MTAATSPTPAAPPTRPRVWPLVVAYLVAFVLAFVGGALYILAAVLPRALHHIDTLADDTTAFALSAPGLLGVAFVTAVTIGLVTTVAALLMRPAPTSGEPRSLAAVLRLGPTRATWVGIAAAIAGLLGSSMACGAVADLAHLGENSVLGQIAHVLAAPTPLRLVLALLAIGVAPGIAEECFFRGLIQTRLRARWGQWPAIGLTALGFGVFHLDPLQGTFALLAGLFLGWTAERFGGIRPTIVAHAANNGITVVLTAISSPDDHPTRAASVAVLAGGAAAFAGAVLVLRSRLAVR